MLNSEIRKILCNQLELLAEVSKSTSQFKDMKALLPELTRAMCMIAKTINDF